MSQGVYAQISDADVTAVAKDFFLDGLVLNVNVYLRLKQDAYILIGRKGDVSAISSYSATQREDAQLYVKNNEYQEALTHNMNFTEKVVRTPNVQAATKLRYINALADSTVNDLFKFGVGVANIENLKRMTGFIHETTENIESISDVLMSLEALPNNMAKHAMGTAFMSLLLAQEMNVTFKAALEKLVLGALVHDIGLREIPVEILNKPRISWSEVEVQYYESHPLRGVEILRDIPQISTDVLLIVNEHHENAVGLGYPRRIRDVKMNPLARIVALADYTIDMMYNPTNPAASLDEVVNHIETHLGQPYNKQVFMCLKNLANKQHLINKKSG